MIRRVINIKGIFQLAPMPHLTSPADVSYRGAQKAALLFGETPMLTARPLWPPRNNTVRVWRQRCLYTPMADGHVLVRCAATFMFYLWVHFNCHSDPGSIRAAQRWKVKLRSDNRPPFFGPLCVLLCHTKAVSRIFKSWHNCKMASMIQEIWRCEFFP
jgi:hypothetical protein